MRIRTYPTVGFVATALAAGYLGLVPSTLPSYKQSDKALHFITFFLLTLCFYWILETNRRRNLQVTLFVCPVVLGIGSEIVQGILPNGRDFDPFDIIANIFGSMTALALCMWYHKRMLERKRRDKHYDFTSGEDADIELGEGVAGQETGVTREQTLEEEVDNWDENVENWEVDEPTGTEIEGEGQKTPPSSVGEAADVKKRYD